ncbi:MAG TPA: MFS transporter [Dehalococcoidia bacterium]|nr:MFS transporter [Dehalococcoidia bacterium]
MMGDFYYHLWVGMFANIRDRFLLSLQFKDYRNLWIATTCSGAAAWALILARGWLAYDITDNNSLWVGIVTFGAMIPRLFSTPIFGFLADRFDRQTLLRWIFGLNLAHNLILAFLVTQGWIGPWSLLLLSLFNGTLRAGQMTIATALIPNLVPKEHLLNAIALNQATQQGSRLVGALAIAPLLGLVNIEAAFWLCSGFYAIGLIQIGLIVTKSTGVIDATQSFARNMVEGFVYVYQRPQILVMVLLVLAHCALTMSYESILPAISEEKLGAGSVGIAYLLAGVGAGALAASIFMAGVQSTAARGKLFLFFGISSGLGPILMAWSSVDTYSIAAAVVMGINQAGFMTISHTIIQTLTEDKVRGRVAGVYSVHVGGSMAVTNLVNAIFADMFSASAVMAMGGGLFIVVIVLSVGSRQLRRIYFPKPLLAPMGAD